jgi:hypothetical protein
MFVSPTHAHRFAQIFGAVPPISAQLLPEMSLSMHHHNTGLLSLFKEFRFT